MKQKSLSHLAGVIAGWCYLPKPSELIVLWTLPPIANYGFEIQVKQVISLH